MLVRIGNELGEASPEGEGSRPHSSPYVKETMFRVRSALFWFDGETSRTKRNKKSSEAFEMSIKRGLKVDYTIQEKLDQSAIGDPGDHCRLLAGISQVLCKCRTALL